MNQLTELAELSIGDDELAQSSQTIKRLIAVLLSSVLVDWRTWNSSASAIDILGLPCEVLEQVALVLCEKEDLGLLDNIAEVVDQSLTLCGELLGWAGQVPLVEEAIERNINLLVAWDLAALESCNVDS